jgi:hypothetical protein
VTQPDMTSLCVTLHYCAEVLEHQNYDEAL